MLFNSLFSHTCLAPSFKASIDYANAQKICLGIFYSFSFILSCLLDLGQNLNITFKGYLLYNDTKIQVKYIITRVLCRYWRWLVFGQKLLSGTFNSNQTDTF